MESNSRHITGIDSCIILRLILGDNLEQRELVQNLILGGGYFYIDDVAIMEVVHVLDKLHCSRPNIAMSIKSLLENTAFICNKDFFSPIFEQFVKSPSLSFDDLVLAANIEQRGIATLWTFDRKFAHQSKTARLLES